MTGSGRRLAAAVAVAALTGVTVPAAPAQAAPAPADSPILADSVRAEQLHLKTLDIADAWPLASGAGVTVAVIDSGVDARHEDLDGQVLPGLDLVTAGGDANRDPVGHGTTVSAIIAGRNDADGVVGIAPKSKILPIRVLDTQNRYDDALVVAKAVRWAVDHGAEVINLSLGGSGDSPALAAAIDYAFAKDVVIVACTGNSSASTSPGVWYPAREPGVVAVAGMESDGSVLWNGSVTGRETVVTAPATNLVGARPGGYWRVQGTSFAAPMVSGTAALIRSRWPDMSAADVVNRIVRTATDRGPLGRDATYGFGLIDPVRALTAPVSSVVRNPLGTSPPRGVARFGDAPSAGQPSSSAETAVATPETSAASTVGARISGANAGSVIPGSRPQPSAPSTAAWWWAAVVLLLMLPILSRVRRRLIHR